MVGKCKSHVGVAVLVALACALACLAGCDSGGPSPADATATAAAQATPTPAPQPTDTEVVLPGGLTQDDEVTLYSKVITRLLNGESATTVYISPYAGEGDQLDQPNQNLPIPPALADTLDSIDRGRNYSLLDFSQAVGSLDNGGAVKNNGIYFTLGPIVIDNGTPNDTDAKPSSVTIKASIYRKVGSAEGDTLTFVPDSTSAEGWKLSGLTQDWNNS